MNVEYSKTNQVALATLVVAVAVQCTQAVLPTRLTYATFYIFSHMYSQTIIPTRTIRSLRLKICGGKVFDILANSFARPFLNLTGMAGSRNSTEKKLAISA